METTVVYWGYVGIMERMETVGINHQHDDSCDRGADRWHPVNFGISNVSVIAKALDIKSGSTQGSARRSCRCLSLPSLLHWLQLLLFKHEQTFW